MSAPDDMCVCGHTRRAHFGAGTCLAGLPDTQATVCPCLTFTQAPVPADAPDGATASPQATTEPT